MSATKPRIQQPDAQSSDLGSARQDEAANGGLGPECQDGAESGVLGTERHGFTRASFLKAGGALIVGMAAVPAAAKAAAGKGARETLRPIITPATEPTTFPSVPATHLSSWLAVQANGKVTVFTGKVELGQGNLTALGQIVAEELDVPFDSLEMVSADTAYCVDQGGTDGSSTISRGGSQLRLAAANGRQFLVGLASQELGVPAEKLTVREGIVSVKGEPSKAVSYADLVGGKVLSETIPGKETKVGSFTLEGAKPKSPDEYSVVGVSYNRPDIPEKVKAEYTYAQDVVVPGMLHGRVVRPPALEATLISYGKVPEGVKVVHVNNFLAVAAEEEYAAIQAAESLKASAKWSTRKILPKMNELEKALVSAPQEEKVIEAAGNVGAGLASAATKIEAIYNTPFQMHASLGPCCTVADVQSDHAVIYAGTAQPNGLQEAIASFFGWKPEQVRLINYPAAGNYGQNCADDVGVAAAIMSKELGVPVRVQFMREDEHGWEPKGPPTTHSLHGGLDAEGKVVAFLHEGWLANNGSGVIWSSWLGGEPIMEPESLQGWSGDMFYTFPNMALISHQEDNLASVRSEGRPGLVSSDLRSPGQLQVSFAEESFIDELAAAAKADPVQFRLSQLKEPRQIAVLELAAEMAEWQTRPSPSPEASSSKRVVKGHGAAISLRGGTYNADVCELEVDRKTGKVTVNKFWVAQDNGLTINPRAVKLGAEAGVVQTVSRTLWEEVTFNSEMITSLDWTTYPILRMEEAPEVEVEIINRPEIAASGSGEPSCCPVPAAIGNAIFDATGARVRFWPMRPERVKEVLDALPTKG